MIFGFAYGGWVTQSAPVVGEYFGLKHMGTILAMIISSFGLGGMVGPILGGYTFDVTGSYYPAFLSGAGFCAIAAVLSFIVKPPKICQKQNG